MESWLHKVCVARYGTNVPIVIAWRRAIDKKRGHKSYQVGDRCQ